MTITYELGNSLYVNITNRCSNACEFCVRSKHDNVNGHDNLWLDREPTIEEIKADFEKRDLSKYDAVVFCGYGEPTERFDDMIKIAKYLKAKSGIAIRVNTNGQANLINGRDVTPELEGTLRAPSPIRRFATADTARRLSRLSRTLPKKQSLMLKTLFSAWLTKPCRPRT